MSKKLIVRRKYTKARLALMNAGIVMREMAKYCQVSVSYLSLILNGKRRNTAVENAVANMTGKKPGEIFEWRK